MGEEKKLTLSEQCYELGKLYRVLIYTLRPGNGPQGSEWNLALRMPFRAVTTAIYKLHEVHKTPEELERLIAQSLDKIDVVDWFGPDGAGMDSVSEPLKNSFLRGYCERLNCSPIQKYRVMRGMTQKELAEALETSQPLVASWEKGATQPNAESLIKMGELFNCDISDLIQKGK